MEVLDHFRREKGFVLTILDILIDLRCVVARISFLDSPLDLRHSNPQVQGPHWCATSDQAHRSSSRRGILGVVHFLHQPFLRRLGWPRTWPLHGVVVTGLMRRDKVRRIFWGWLRVTASFHGEPTRLVMNVIVQQRSWETGEVQPVSRMPRAQVTVNEPKAKCLTFNVQRRFTFIFLC